MIKFKQYRYNINNCALLNAENVLLELTEIFINNTTKAYYTLASF